MKLQFYLYNKQLFYNMGEKGNLFPSKIKLRIHLHQAKCRFKKFTFVQSFHKWYNGKENKGEGEGQETLRII